MARSKCPDCSHWTESVVCSPVGGEPTFYSFTCPMCRKHWYDNDWGKLYLVQDGRQLVGDSVLWWRAEARGYTTDIGEAGRFTKAELKDLNLRPTDNVYTEEQVLPAVRQHVPAHFLGEPWKEK